MTGLTHGLFTFNAAPFNSMYFLSQLAVHELHGRRYPPKIVKFYHDLSRWPSLHDSKTNVTNRSLLAGNSEAGTTKHVLQQLACPHFRDFRVHPMRFFHSAVTLACAPDKDGRIAATPRYRARGKTHDRRDARRDGRRTERGGKPTVVS